MNIKISPLNINPQLLSFRESKVSKQNSLEKSPAKDSFEMSIGDTLMTFTVRRII